MFVGSREGKRNLHGRAFNVRASQIAYKSTYTLALFSSLKKQKAFQDFLSHQILQHMHKALNIVKNKN